MSVLALRDYQAHKIEKGSSAHPVYRYELSENTNKNED